MAINLSDNLQIGAGKPIDNKYLNSQNAPYTGVTEVNSTIAEPLRSVGLTVLVGEEEYWYATGTTDSDLVVKTADVASAGGITGATNGLTKVGSDVELGGALTSNTIIDTGAANALVVSGQSGAPFFSSGQLGVLPAIGQISLAAGNTTCTGLANISTAMLAGTTPVATLQTINTSSSDDKAIIQTQADIIDIRREDSGNTDYHQICITSAGMFITDNQNTKGLEYVADYSANFTARSLVDADYVTGLTTTSGVQTANNGLTKTGTNVRLGGNLTGDTTVSGNTVDMTFTVTDGTQGGYSKLSECGIGFCVNQVGGAFGNSYTQGGFANTGTQAGFGSVSCVSGVTGIACNAFVVAAGQFASLTQDVTNDNCVTFTQVAIAGSLTQSFLINDGSNDQGIVQTTSGIGIEDSIASCGMFYDADYSGNFTDRSIVDKEYVDTVAANASGSSLNTASNGLTVVGNDVQLGGTLDSFTTLDAQGNGFRVDEASVVSLRNAANADISVTGSSALLDINGKTNSQVVIKSQSGSLDGDDFTNGIGFNLDYNASLFSVTDNRPTAAGLQYVSDYSLNYTDRSLVDKAYVDAVATGLDAKEASILATTQADGNIDLTGGTFASGSTLDGIVVQDGWRVLIKNQTNAAQNGIYDYSASASGFTRSADFDGNPAGEVSQGSFTFVVTGNTLSSTSWLVTTPDPITVGTTDINFTIASTSFDLVDGTGTTLTTIGGNRAVSVELAVNSGLDFDAAGSAGRLRIAPSTAGQGISLASGVLNVNITDASVIATGIDIKSDTGGADTLFVDSSEIATTIAPADATSFAWGAGIGYNGAYTLEASGNDIATSIAGAGDIGAEPNWSAPIGYTAGAYQLEASGNAIATNLAGAGDIGAEPNWSAPIGYTGADQLEASGNAIATNLAQSNDATLFTAWCGIIGYTGSDSLVTDGYGIATSLAPNDATSFTNSITNAIGYNSTGTLELSGQYISEAIAPNDATSFTNEINSAVGYTVGGTLSLSGQYISEAIGVDASSFTNEITNAVGYTVGGTLTSLSGQYISEAIAPNDASGFASCVDGIGYTSTGTLVLNSACLQAAVTGGTVNGAENGLTVTNNIVTLGGTLTGDTQIALNNFGLAIGGVDATGAYAVATGRYGCAAGDYSFSAGFYARATGQTSVALGTGKAYADNAFAHMGCVTATAGIAIGTNSFSSSACAVAIGQGSTASSENAVAFNGGTASGERAFAGGASATASGDNAIAIGYGAIASGDYSVVLGGEDNQTSVPNTAVFGGTNINVTAATLQNYVINSNLAIWNTPDAGTTGDVTLVWDSSDKKVKTLPVSGITGTISAANGLTKAGDTVVLGGTMTGDTVIDAGSGGLAFGNIGGKGGNICVQGAASMAIGRGTCVIGDYSFASGSFAYVGANCSVALNQGSVYIQNAFAANSATACANASTAINGGTTYGVGTFAANNSCAFGSQSSSFGSQTIASGTSSMAIGLCTCSLGAYSFAGGQGHSATDRLILAAGENSFNFSRNNVASVAGEGAIALASAILGGTNHHIASGNTSAAIIGGDGIKLTGSSYADHTAVSNLAIFGTPATGTNSDPVLVWDSTDKKVKQLDASNLGEDNNSYAITAITSATLTADNYVAVVQTSGATQTVTLPSSPVDGQAFKIKDRGNALTNNITVSGNGNNIDGSATASINTDYGALELVYSSDAGEWLSLAFIN